jgi:DNA gyrase subunit A
MRLVRLTGLERDKVEAEYAELMKKIADYQDILAKPERIHKLFIKNYWKFRTSLATNVGLNY